MTEEEKKKIIENLIPLFEKAGRICLELRRQGLKKEIKEDNTPVTNGDIEVNNLITTDIKKITPEIPIVSEEVSTNKSNENLKNFWLIDPIDGTYDYINNRDEFTINAGLIINNKPEAGIIYAPAKKRLFYSYHQGKSFEMSDNKKKILDCKKISKKAKIICLDEFSISDIADAMILGNLLKELFHRGVTLILTSNTEPDKLYLNGLQRERFLPAINLIKKNTNIFFLNSNNDYRLSFLEKADIYQYPITEDNNIKIKNYFNMMAANKIENKSYININNRKINTIKISDSIIWFNFDDICSSPRNKNDYIEIIKYYKTVIITNIPVLTLDHENQARRFITLIDEFYDRKVKMIFLAAAAIDKLYSGKKLAFEFQGEQHKVAIPHWGGEEKLRRQKTFVPKYS